MTWTIAFVFRILATSHRLDGLYPSLKYIRAAEGFFPKYRAWYLPSRPDGFTSGAGPRGSFS